MSCSIAEGILNLLLSNSHWHGSCGSLT